MKTGAYKNRSLPAAVSITEGVIWKQLLLFFFPIVLGTFFQQLYNTVDAIIVGRFLGKEALSAVGGGTGTVVNLILGCFIGLTAGASVIISQFFGSGDKDRVSVAVHTSMAFSLAGGVAVTILGLLFAPALLALLGTPEEILDPAVRYIRIFFIGVMPQVIYNMAASILRAIGDSRRPFYYLIIGTLTNIVLDILFIVVLNLGVEGAALATIISQAVAGVLSCLALMRTTECYRLIISKISFNIPVLKSMVRLGVPSAIQSVMYTVSNLIIAAYVNSFDTNTIAGWAAFGKVDSLFWMVINSFGIAITTFSGQNYGAGKIDRVKKGVIQCGLMAYIATAVLTFLFMKYGAWIYMLFTDDVVVIARGYLILRSIAWSFFTFIPIELLSGTIRGTGRSFVPMMITTCFICILRIIWLLTVVPVRNDITTVCYSYPVSWIVTGMVFIVYYIVLARKNFARSVD